MTIWSELQQVVETHSDQVSSEAINHCFKAVAVELWKQKTAALVVMCIDLTVEIQNRHEHLDVGLDGSETQHIIESCHDMLSQLSMKLRKAHVDISASVRDLLDQYDLPYAPPDFEEITDLFQTPMDLQKASTAYQKLVERYHIMLQQAA